jgi:hypothetical protein
MREYCAGFFGVKSSRRELKLWEKSPSGHGTTNIGTIDRRENDIREMIVGELIIKLQRSRIRNPYLKESVYLCCKLGEINSGTGLHYPVVTDCEET